jgi:hypothetical protein
MPSTANVKGTRINKNQNTCRPGKFEEKDLTSHQSSFMEQFSTP